MPLACDVCGGWKNADQGIPIGSATCTCLTFAEAVALHATLVEGSHNHGAWMPLGEFAEVPLAILRTCRFRKAQKPKRSRVQEMAEAESISYPVDVPLTQQAEAHYRRAIRAVCEFLRTCGQNGKASGFANMVNDEFLEPR